MPTVSKGAIYVDVHTVAFASLLCVYEARVYLLHMIRVY